MSCCVNVLVNTFELINVDNISDEYVNTFRKDMENEYEREVFAKDLRDRVAEWMEEDYKGAVEYVKEYIPNIAPDSDEFILGVERPEKIREIAANWNMRNSNHVIREIENFEGEMRKNGFNSLSDFLKSKIEPNSGLFSGIKYPASFYSLRKVLDAADDMFTYDSPSDLLFVEYKDKEGRERGTYGVTMDEDTKAEILAHPERYVLINICYD